MSSSRFFSHAARSVFFLAFLDFPATLDFAAADERFAAAFFVRVELVADAFFARVELADTAGFLLLAAL